MRIVAIPRSGVRPIWTALAVVAFVVLAAITAKADEKVIRIGYQKYGTLILLKAKGSLEAKLKPLGYRVAWGRARLLQPVDETQQGALAAAALAHDGHELASRNVQVEAA